MGERPLLQGVVAGTMHCGMGDASQGVPEPYPSPGATVCSILMWDGGRGVPMDCTIHVMGGGSSVGNSIPMWGKSPMAPSAAIWGGGEEMLLYPSTSIEESFKGPSSVRHRGLSGTFQLPTAKPRVTYPPAYPLIRGPFHRVSMEHPTRLPPNESFPPDYTTPLSPSPYRGLSGTFQPPAAKLNVPLGP